MLEQQKQGCKNRERERLVEFDSSFLQEGHIVLWSTLEVEDEVGVDDAGFS
jgi:hypothetical protein